MSEKDSSPEEHRESILDSDLVGRILFWWHSHSWLCSSTSDGMQVRDSSDWPDHENGPLALAEHREEIQ